MKRSVLLFAAIVAFVIVGCQDESVLEPNTSTHSIPAGSAENFGLKEGKGKLTISGLVYDYAPPGWPDKKTAVKVNGAAKYEILSSSTTARFSVSLSAKLVKDDGAIEWVASGLHRSVAILNNQGTAIVTCVYPVIGQRHVRLRVICEINGNEMKFKSVSLERIDL